MRAAEGWTRNILENILQNRSFGGSPLEVSNGGRLAAVVGQHQATAPPMEIFSNPGSRWPLLVRWQGPSDGTAGNPSCHSFLPHPGLRDLQIPRKSHRLASVLQTGFDISYSFQNPTSPRHRHPQTSPASLAAPIAAARALATHGIWLHYAS